MDTDLLSGPEVTAVLERLEGVTVSPRQLRHLDALGVVPPSVREIGP